MLNTVKEVCLKIGRCIDRKPLCIETGSTHDIRTHNLVHTTTNNLVEHVCVPNGGVLLSLDVDAGHQSLASFACPEDSPVVFVYGDSQRSLMNISKLNLVVDLLCLDSKEFDKDHAVREFKAIEKNLKLGRHFVLVDDIHNSNSVKYINIVPLLKDLGYSFLEASTPTGLFVAFKGYAFSI